MLTLHTKFKMAATVTYPRLMCLGINLDHIYLFFQAFLIKSKMSTNRIQKPGESEKRSFKWCSTYSRLFYSFEEISRKPIRGKWVNFRHWTENKTVADFDGPAMN